MMWIDAVELQRFWINNSAGEGLHMTGVGFRRVQQPLIVHS